MPRKCLITRVGCVSLAHYQGKIGTVVEENFYENLVTGYWLKVNSYHILFYLNEVKMIPLIEVLKDNLKNSIKHNLPEKAIIRVVLGEISTVEARNNKPLTDEEIQKIFKKMIQNNLEMIEKAKLSAENNKEIYDKLIGENLYLSNLIPKSVSKEDIVIALQEIKDDIKNAKSDGQATGVAMKFLKSKSIAVQGNDVAEAVKIVRA